MISSLFFENQLFLHMKVSDGNIGNIGDSIDCINSTHYFYFVFFLSLIMHRMLLVWYLILSNLTRLSVINN